MNPENFLVRLQLEAVERFQQRAVWSDLSEADRVTLQRHVAGLPTELPPDDLESRLFDLTVLRMQLAHARGEVAAFEKDRRRVMEMAALLEEKASIPAVAAQLAYLASLQEAGFWEGIGLPQLEELRERMRGLVPFLDKKSRKVVYTNFKDGIQAVRVEEPLAIPKMTGAQYAKKVAEYLRSHLDHIAIHKLRQNRPLTPTDLESLRQILLEIGDEDGETLLTGLLEQNEAPSLAYFIRRLVGLDRNAAKEAFNAFLENQSLTPRQIRFVDLIIDQLTASGVIEAKALYEPPFSDLDDGGPEAVFAGKETLVDELFEALDRTARGLREAK